MPFGIPGPDPVEEQVTALRRFEAVSGIELRTEWHERIAARAIRSAPSEAV